MNLQLGPEFSLLCLAARPASNENMDALRAAVSGTYDWPAVIEGAQHNRVTPLVLASLQACGSSQILPDVIAELRRQTIVSVARSLGQIPALESLHKTFTQAGIPFLAVKGIALSLQLYGEATRRTADDIDLLVSPDQFWRADAALTQSGYRSDDGPPTGGQRDVYKYWVKHIRYVHEHSKIIVELHHRLTTNPYLLDWPFEECWKDRIHVRVGGTEVATLSSRRLPLYLCAHGANHGWERLRWLVDLTIVFQGLNGTDELLTEAETAGLGPPMLQALVLAHEWLGYPLAAQHLADAKQDRRVKRLDRCLGHFLGGTTWRRRPSFNSWEGLWRYSIWIFLHNLSLKADWRYRAYQCAAIWIYPPDWDTFRLPAALHWLYPVIRPFTWLIRRLRG
jgi:hypothetical protein